jgi:hypothetical protein
MVKNRRDKKISEFNYKVLHNILPCNKNLKKWGKQTNDTCDVCQQIQSIIHLLYECPHSGRIWQKLKDVLGIDVDVKNLILGGEYQTPKLVKSLISYLLYKEWLICKNENEIRGWAASALFMKREIKLRVKIYQSLGWEQICDKLNEILIIL